MCQLLYPVFYHLLLQFYTMWYYETGDLYMEPQRLREVICSFLQLESDGSDSHIFLEKGKAIQFKNLYTHKS